MLDLPDFRLETFFARWEFDARHHLTASDAESMTVAELLALGSPAERAAFDALPLVYQPTWGGPALRAAIATLYDSCGPDEVLAFAGAEEALFWTLMELVTERDHAIVTVPNYQSMEEVVRATGASLTGLPLRYDGGWTFDLEDLEKTLRPNTRLIAVNFPNNPTGFSPDRDVFEALVRLCDERGIWLFSDEVYRGLELEAHRRLPQAADLSERGISLNVMSKSFGLPGLRIGWVACRDRSMLSRLERRKHYTSICNAAPSEALAVIALNNRDEIWKKNRQIISDNLLAFDAFFAKWSDLFEWYHPDGGCVAFPRYLGDDDCDSFCGELLHREGVLLLPPSIYRSPLLEVPTDRFRIGVGRRNPEPALEAFDHFLESR